MRARIGSTVHALLFCAAALAPAGAQALEFTVVAGTDLVDVNPGDGICAAVADQPSCTLRAAVMESNALGGAHDVVLGVPDIVLDRAGAGDNDSTSGDLDISSDISIAAAGDETVSIAAVLGDRVFDVHEGFALRLEGVHVSGGRANTSGTQRGGGLLVRLNASLVLARSLLTDNLANAGGAIYSSGTVDIADSELSGNGVVSTFLGPASAIGAAIALAQGHLSIARSTFRGNGIAGQNDPPDFVADAYAVHARRAFAGDASVSVVNSSFLENAQGLAVQQMPALLDRVTIATHAGTGFRFSTDPQAPEGIQLDIARSVITANALADCDLLGDEQAMSLADRHNANSDASCDFTGPSSVSLPDWPFLGDPAPHGGPLPVLVPDPTGLLADAIAYPGVDCADAALEDQRGKTRPLDADLDGGFACDIGAVEYDPASDPPPPPAADTAGAAARRIRGRSLTGAAPHRRTAGVRG